MIKRNDHQRMLLSRDLIREEPNQMTHQPAILLTGVTPHFVSWLGSKLRVDLSVTICKISCHHLMLAREQLDVRTYYKMRKMLSCYFSKHTDSRVGRKSVCKLEV